MDGSVTGQGSRAKLPTETKIYPPGSTITGTDGCPTTRYHTDGMIVAVIDYQGRPTAGSVDVTRHPASGGQFNNAPYYLDLDKGRTLQFLGPVFENGSYDVRLTYDFSLGQGKTVSSNVRAGAQLSSDSMTALATICLPSDEIKGLLCFHHHRNTRWSLRG